MNESVVIDWVDPDLSFGGKEQEIKSDLIRAHFSFLHKVVTKRR